MKRVNKTYGNFGSSLSKEKASANKWATSRVPVKKGKSGHGHGNGHEFTADEEYQKELKLVETLHDAETNQLQTFIKTRNKELDDEIKKLRSKNASSSFSMENDSLEQKANYGSNLTVTGSGLGKANIEFQENPSKEYLRDRNHIPSEKRALSPSHKDRLVTLLARMKLKMEDLNISCEEIKEILLPSDLIEPGETLISLQELVNVLQTDLLIPITNGDQMMLLREYGIKDSTDVDVKSLLQDAGVWIDEPTQGHFYDDIGIRLKQTNSSSSRSPSPIAGTKRMTSPYRESPPGSPTLTKFFSDLNDSDWTTANHSGKLRDFQSQQLNSTIHTSERNLDELSQFHKLIAMEDDFDVVTSSKVNTNQSKQQPLLSSQSHSYFKTTLPVVMEEDEFEQEEKKKPVSESKDLFHDKVPVEKLTALQKENELLKREIGAFDSEFFEQLEDLKYRYSRLQEIVGESPGVSKTSNTIRGNQSPSKNKLPLDRLAWSTRNSMTAIDKASYDSDLISRPRYPNAYTYSPGGENKYSSHSHIGGSIPSTRTVGNDSSLEYKQYSDDLGHLRSPKKLPPNFTGGFHGIGTGSNSLIHGGDDSLSSLCERRLAFELSSHPAPEQATRALVHRVMEVTGKKNDGVYISCNQLSDVIASVGLKMAPKEIEALCTGFASDGKGGIDAVEFCEMVKTLLYNLVGEHAARAAEMMATKNSQKEKNDYYKIMEELCEDIITHDKHAVIGSSRDLFKLFIQFFMEKDINGSGVITFESFSEVLKDIGSMLSYEDKFTIAIAFIVNGDKAATAFPSSNLNHINAFKTMKLQGSMRGASKSNAVFGDWLSSSQMSLDNYKDNPNDFAIDDMKNILIEYPRFVTNLVEILEKYIDTRGGIPLLNKIPWFLKEYDFINILITQLEAMRPTQRRKVLMTLQYSLNVADPKQDGSLDGFAVLNGLLSSGFVLQRFNRVQLLRAVEEMGGKMNYQDLCQVLLNSSSAWFQEEKSMVMKILKSMGTTVTQRRSWLAHLRLNLIEASARLIKKHGDWVVQSNIVGEDNDLGIPPSAFLHCLRDCGVDLTVEEEATLLDCLDTERLAKTSYGNEKSVNGTLYNGIQGKEHWSIPLIQFESFLTFCGRHCGEWYDAAPEIHDDIKIGLKSINNPALCVQEFISLLHGFDEKNNGEISKRSFQICCHRSRLFANLPELKINKLAEILSIDGGGKVRYPSFVVYLQSVSSQMNLDGSEPSLINQLIQKCTDTIGTLMPLRNWLVKHTDITNYILTKKDLNAMLREFSVIYRPDDLDLLIMQIGKKMNTRTNTAMDNIIPSSIDMSHTFAVDSRDLMTALLKSMSNWTVRHPSLCKKIKTLLKSAGSSFLTEENTHKDEKHSTFHHKVRGVETAVARKLLTRLRAFASKSKGFKDETIQTVEKEIFAYLTKIAGISLSIEEIAILADATDNYPEANRIKCNVILDAIIFDPDQLQLNDPDHELTYSSTMKRQPLSEAGVFALEHIRHLLWTNAARLHRTSVEWVADVRAVFQGFDYGKSGFISTEDFQIALTLLNSAVSHDMLLNISYFPEMPGLIEYRDILNYLLIHPTEKTIHHEEDYQTFHKKEDYIETAKFKVKTKVDKESPIRVLIHVVRRSLNQFIVSDHSLETAWVHLLKVFKRFDPQETDKISPRDFCLAVSVLMEGEEIVLTKPEWSEIIDYFSANLEKTNTTNSIYGGVLVDYMLFCESVLDPHDLDIKIRDYRTGDISRKIDRSKQYLSKPSNRTVASNQTGTINKTFDGTVTGSSFSNSRTIGSRNNNNSPNKNKTFTDKNDDIVRKFRESSNRTKTSTLDGMTQVTRNERSKSPWNTDNLYKTNKTQERLKDSTLAKIDHSIFDNRSSSRSISDVYSSSHRNAKTTNRFR